MLKTRNMPGSDPEKRKTGFTLIELLVVVAIIAVLVAIFLPVLSKARKLARDAVCRTRVQKIALAIHEYASENGGQTMSPMWNRDGLGWGGPNPTWRNDLFRWGFLPNKESFICPRMGGRGCDDWDEYHASHAPKMGGYGLNCAWKGFLPDGNIDYCNVNMDRLADPATKVLIGDNNGDWPLHQIFDDVSLMYIYPNEGLWAHAVDVTRHEGNSAMIGFADGHVAARIADQIHPPGNYWMNFRY